MSLVPNTLATQLQQILYDAMYNGFKATYLYGAGREGEAMAQKFAKTVSQNASMKLANAITNYIKTATIMGGVVTTTGSFGPSIGPITVQPTIS